MDEIKNIIYSIIIISMHACLRVCVRARVCVCAERNIAIVRATLGTNIHITQRAKISQYSAGRIDQNIMQYSDTGKRGGMEERREETRR